MITNDNESRIIHAINEYKLEQRYEFSKVLFLLLVISDILLYGFAFIFMGVIFSVISLCQLLMVVSRFIEVANYRIPPEG